MRSRRSARFEEKARERSNLNWMSYVDLNLRLPELLLMRVDKMSMGVSLEARVPFLDHTFVEFAMSIPEKSKTNGGTLKHILKKAVRGVIPDELIDRPKQGFGVPIHEWFLERLGPEMALASQGDGGVTVDLPTRTKSWRSSTRTARWSRGLLNLALWHKEYIA
jgi:asparagine synthase (glutamine-hydrolysing)